MHRHPTRHRANGMAMPLVLMAVAMAVILSISFLNAQTTATGMAQNVARSAQARAIAESGIKMALAYINTNETWRTDMTHGAWVTDHPFAGGSFSIVGQDGQDTNGDGVPDGDGDLSNEKSDVVTFTATGRFAGVTHTIQTVTTPKPPNKRLLMVVPDPSNLATEEKDRAAQFEEWAYKISYIGEGDSQSAFNSAVASSDVAYISENCYSDTVNTKLRGAIIGVVWEESHMNDLFGLASSNGSEYTGSNSINVTDNTHTVTQSFSNGNIAIVGGTQAPLNSISGTLAPGATVLATRSASSTPVLAVIEAGGALVGGSQAAGRRVALPWGGNNFNWLALTPAGLTIVKEALWWASQPIFAGRVAYWSFDNIAGNTVADTVSGLNATLKNGVVTQTPGAILGSEAILFDGANDHAEVPHDDLFLLDEGTFALWFKTDDTSSTQGLITKDSTDFDTGGHMSIYIHEGDHAEARLQSTSNSYKVKTPHVLQANTWYHLVFTFGPAGMKLYLNGVLQNTDSYTGGMGTTSGGSGNYEPMAFGVSTWETDDLSMSVWEEPLSGQIDEVYVYNRALTQAEIQKLNYTNTGNTIYSTRWVDQP